MAAQPASSPTVTRFEKWWNNRTTRVVTTILVLALAVYIVSRSIKPEEFKDAFAHMDPWWFAGAVGIGAITWVGAAITMAVFVPIKVRLLDIFLVQVASSFAGVVAPSGLGSFALSVRFLVVQKMQTTQAVAAIVLMEIAQFITSVILLAGAIFIVGINPDINIKWDIVGWVAISVVAVIAIILAIGRLRRWLWQQVTTIWKRVQPQVVWAFKHPKQFSIAMGGSVLQTAAFAGTFVCSLLAFGVDVDFVKVAAAYLVANTLGSLIPVPGGVGTIEATLTVGMTAIGVPAAVALSAAVTFRLATFYLQIPIGWFAFQWLRRRRLV